jgi:hypothetical protein
MSNEKIALTEKAQDLEYQLNKANDYGNFPLAHFLAYELRKVILQLEALES